MRRARTFNMSSMMTLEVDCELSASRADARARGRYQCSSGRTSTVSAARPTFAVFRAASVLQYSREWQQAGLRSNGGYGPPVCVSTELMLTAMSTALQRARAASSTRIPVE